ncbi:hypothetical protein GEMRC1_008085 [Eukaryota sp. GEM-RC1]
MTQFGVKVKCGTEKIVHKIRQLKKTNSFHTLISLDIRNAFNTVKRSHIYDLLQSEFPDFINFFNFGYGKNSPLIFNHSLISSSSGVKQGDPCSPFFYSLATLGILKDFSSSPNVEVLSYLDDTYLLLRNEESAESVLEGLSFKFQNLGLVLNLSKTKILDVDHDLLVLGSPVGSKQFETQFLKTMFRLKSIVSCQTSRICVYSFSFYFFDIVLILDLCTFVELFLLTIPFWHLVNGQKISLIFFSQK